MCHIVKNNSRKIEFILAHKYLENILRDIFKNDEIEQNLEKKLAIFSIDSAEESENFYADIYIMHKKLLFGLFSDGFQFFKRCKDVKTELIDEKIKELNLQGIDNIVIIMNSSTYR